jgi:hypothetical protein
VKVNNVGLWELVGLIFDKILDRRQVREGFHAKFAVKAAAQGVKDLVLLLRSMPNCVAISTSV